MNLDLILKDIPGKFLNESRAYGVRTLVDCLESDFTTAQSHIENVVPDYDRGCVSVIFDTPYITSAPDNRKYLADLFRIADAVAFDVTGDGDDMIVSIIFTVKVWDE